MPESLKPSWAGEPVEPAVMLEYIQRVLASGVVGALHYALEYPDYQRTAETLFFLRIVYFDQIEGTLVTQAAFDGVVQKREVRNGDFLIGGYNSQNFILEKDEKPRGGLSIIFHPHFIRIYYGRYDHGLIPPQVCYHIRRGSAALLSMFQALGDILKETDSERDLRCRPLLTAIFQQLAVELRRISDDQEVQHEQTALKLRGFIEQNFHQPINCTAICDALHINRTYAASLFKSNFHISMNDYLLQLRIETARYLLLSTPSMKITQIARLCAFASPGYFAQVFRRKTGTSPEQFRMIRNDGVVSNIVLSGGAAGLR